MTILEFVTKMIFNGGYSTNVNGDASGSESTATSNTRPEYDAFTKTFTGFGGDMYSNLRCGLSNFSVDIDVDANESFGGDDSFNDSFATANNTFYDVPTVSTITPRLHLSNYESLRCPPSATKIIINCSTTNKFLEHINSPAVNLSSDIIILSLDPAYATAGQPLHIQQYIKALNRTLQNFVSSFYTNNPLVHQLIHELPSDLEITSPILGGNLLTQFFNLTRLIKLIGSINPNIETLIVSDDESNLATGLAIACLMDTYNYNLAASYNIIKRERPSVRTMNVNFYDDLIVVENLKRYYRENNQLKKGKVVLTNNSKLKRKDADEEDMEMGKKRRFRNE